MMFLQYLCIVAAIFGMVNARCSQTLRKGSSGECVKVVQRKVKVNDDGIFGPQTLAAVKHFQRQNGLAVDGIVGKNTWAAIYDTTVNAWKFAIICGSNAIRGNDDLGRGSYGSSRNRNGKKGTHNGIDIVCSDGSNVYAPFDGKITRRARPGSKDCVNDGLKLEGSGTWSGYSAKIFYVHPNKIGQFVKKGHLIGSHLGLKCAYGSSMTDHVHLELYKNGNLVNPTSFV